ncbi:MAG: hypothetical protein AAFS11_04405, partial [Planctomycetota bacterium]
MVSLTVIGAYFALAAWMMTMDVVSWVGKKTELWDISETPIVSAFLAERMLDPVGPPSLGGGGRPLGVNGSLDYAEFFLKRVRGAVNDTAQLTEDSLRTREDVFASYAIQERFVAAREDAELLDLLQNGEATVREVDTSRE